jgi:hypothetical protein
VAFFVFMLSMGIAILRRGARERPEQPAGVG